MLRNPRHIIATSALVILAGCAKQEVVTTPVEPPKPVWNATTCQQTDWYHAGRTRVKNGIVELNIDKVAAECAEQGVYINTAAYFQGLSETAHQYCTPLQGRMMGQQGQAYPNVCQPEIYSEFYFEWYRNLQEYCHAQTLNQTTSASVPAVCAAIKK